MGTVSWIMHFRRGMGLLSRHHPGDAVQSLQKALEHCPASRSRDLYHICFYLGVSLRRIGFSQSAIKSWLSCLRLNKRGHTRKMLSRITNEYGMERQSSGELDDWNAFSSIQIYRYLMGKNKRSFSTCAERDMVVDLIWDNWRALARSGALSGRSGCEKLDLFKQTSVVFPSIVMPVPQVNSPVIAVNFKTKKKFTLSDRCSCGSGLPFILCCGRTPGKEELLGGHF